MKCKYKTWICPWFFGLALAVAFGMAVPPASAEEPFELAESEPSPPTFLETRGVGDGETLFVGLGTTLHYDTSWAGTGAAGVTITEMRSDGAISTLLSLDGEATGDLAWSPGAPGLYTLVHKVEMAAPLTAHIQVLGAETVVHQVDILSGNVTWSAGSIHVVHGTVTVGAGAVLTIERGAVVKFTEGSLLVLASGGQCVANGVIFTPIADDTVGGDTMGDGDASRPAADTYAITGNVVSDEWTEFRWMTLPWLPWNYTVVEGWAVLGGPNGAPAIPAGMTGAVLVPAALEGYPVTGIGDSAFAGCSNLSWVVIQEGVTNIGELAFAGCSNLVSIVIPDNVTAIGARAFEGCESLLSIAIPEGVTRIEEGTFAGCAELTNATIPEGVTYIGDDAFEWCELLESIYVPTTLVDWGLRSLPPPMRTGLEYDASGFLVLDGWVLGHRNPEVTALAIPAGSVGIGNHALADFWELATVEMPDSLKYIGRGAFETNTALDNVVIPDGVERIGTGAFQGCTYMRNLRIGESVECLGREAFAKCAQLMTVTIPDSVVEIGDAAFSGCRRLLSMKLPLGLETTGTGLFAGCTNLTGVTMPTHKFTAAQLFEEQCAALESVSVAGGETAICTEAFKGCSALSSVALPTSLEEVGNEAFGNCQTLRGLELPDGLLRIGEQAFAGCSALTAIAMPDSVTELGAKAFLNCTALANMTLSRGLLEVPDYAFDGCKKLTSMVMPASVQSLGKGIGKYFKTLYYLGNAPAYDAETYSPRSAPVTTYVVQGTRGWDGIPSSRDLPDSWLGYPITFWEPNRFDAIFDANGGAFQDGAATYACEQITGVAYALPPFNPSLEGADFDGWWTDPAEGAQIKATTQVNETREITFYAHWKGTPVAVTVRFNANGGTVEPAEMTYRATLAYESLPVPTREYYRFTGWWTAPSGGNKVVASSRVPAADQELFAHWAPETYAIRYHANGGEGTMADQSFTYGNPVTLRGNAFRRENREFVGWALSPDGEIAYTNGQQFPGIATIEDGVIHLYAVWRGGAYAVRFESNGGTGQMDNQTFAIGEAQSLSPCLFSREWFRFAGWALTPGGAVAYADGETVQDLTNRPNAAVALYAVWTVAETATGVPHEWLAGYGLGDGTEAGYEAAANATAANGIYTVRECYVAGLDPTDENAKFTAEMSFDGTGIPEVQSVDPDLGEERTYTLQGKKDLMDGDWADMATVPEAEKDEYRFFCVGVSLPE